MGIAETRFLEVSVAGIHCFLPCTHVATVLRVQDGMIRRDDQGQTWLLHQRQRWRVLDLADRLLGRRQSSQPLGFCICFTSGSLLRAIQVSTVGEIVAGTQLAYHEWSACLRPFCDDIFAGWLSPQGTQSQTWLPLVSLAKLFGEDIPEPYREPEVFAPSEKIVAADNDTSKTRQLMILNSGLTTERGEQITYGISLAQVAEVMRWGPTFPIPTANSVVLGGLDWYHRPLPVFHLNRWLNVSADTSVQPERVLVVRLSAARSYAAFAVGTEMKVRKDLGGFRPGNPTIGVDASLLMGSYRFSDGWLLVPDFATLLMGAAFV